MNDRSQQLVDMTWYNLHQLPPSLLSRGFFLEWHGHITGSIVIIVGILIIL